jgi:hypothetical protein
VIACSQEKDAVGVHAWLAQKQPGCRLLVQRADAPSRAPRRPRAKSRCALVLAPRPCGAGASRAKARLALRAR